MSWHHLPAVTAEQPFPKGLYRSPFQPAWWLRNSHAQTMFSTLFRRPPVLAREREKITLPDGDWVYVDWLIPGAWQAEQSPLVIIVHGLSGSSDSHYVRGLQQVLQDMGWASAAMNCRGASGGPNGLPRAYHAGASDDIQAVLDVVSERHPQTRLAVVGYSLGGNMTLKLMGELGADKRLFAAVAVSVPLVLRACADRMDSGFSQVYRRHMLTALLADWEQKVRQLELSGQAASAQKLRHHLAQGPFESFWQFDDKLMAPLHGFADVHDYYQRCSSRQFLGAIRIPTLVIQAVDDPFMSASVLPEAQELSPQLHFELATEGGHVGFIAGGSLAAPDYYLERRIPAFLQQCFLA